MLSISSVIVNQSLPKRLIFGNNGGGLCRSISTSSSLIATIQSHQKRLTIDKSTSTSTSTTDQSLIKTSGVQNPRTLTKPLRGRSIDSSQILNSWSIPNFIHTYSTSSSKKNKMTISEGDKIPSGTFSYVKYSPELSSPKVCGVPTKLNTDDWKGKKIVLFGVPGAFTKTCSASHLPDYVKKSAELKSKGVSGIYCIASNDAFVMSGWGRLLGSNEHVEMLSDTTLEWLEKAGLTLDLSAHGLGKRGNRFALIIDDLKVKYVGVEPDAGGVSVSGVDAVLAKL